MTTDFEPKPFKLLGGHLSLDFVNKGTIPKDVKEPLRMVSYNGDLVAFIKSLSQQSNLTTRFDQSLHIANRVATIDMSDTSILRVLQTLLPTQGLTYEHTSCEEILILPKTAVAFYWRTRTN